MNFMIGLPHSKDGYDSIWQIVDKLTKSAHFLPVKATYPVTKLAKLYVKHIVCLHGVPVSIVSDRVSVFTSQFWQQLQEAMGTRLDFNTACHPQTDGQSERMIQKLEDMLRMCVMDLGGSWDDHLPWQSLLTITTTIVVLRWHRMKLCMGGSVDPLCVGMKFEKENYLDQKLFKTHLRKLL